MKNAKRKSPPKPPKMTDLIGTPGLMMLPDNEMWEHAFVVALQLNPETYVLHIFTDPHNGELRIVSLTDLTSRCRLYADEETMTSEMDRMHDAREARETPPA